MRKQLQLERLTYGSNHRKYILYYYKESCKRNGIQYINVFLIWNRHEVSNKASSLGHGELLIYKHHYHHISFNYPELNDVYIYIHRIQNAYQLANLVFIGLYVMTVFMYVSFQQIGSSFLVTKMSSLLMKFSSLVSTSDGNFIKMMTFLLQRWLIDKDFLLISMWHYQQDQRWFITIKPYGAIV